MMFLRLIRACRIAADPNNLMAMFWDDFQVVYDLATNKGVSMVGDTCQLCHY